MVKVKTGFTLVELLVYMGLLASFLVSITWVVTALTETQLDAAATADVDMSAAQLFSRFEHDIGAAELVIAPTTLGTAGSELRLSIDAVEHHYFAQDGVLWLMVDGEAEQLSPVRAMVSDFSVMRLGNVGGAPTVTLSFELRSSIPENAGFETRVMQYTIGTR